MNDAEETKIASVKNVDKAFHKDKMARSGSGYGYNFPYHENEEEFDMYLGQTSYYLSLQRNISKLIKLIKPEGAKILELGFRTGRTAVRIANDHKGSNVVALCEDTEVLKNAIDIAKTHGSCDNITFIEDKIAAFVASRKELEEYDIVYMLYSFHHIPDSEKGQHANKVVFLRDCFINMKLNSYLCIADLFLSDNNSVFEKSFIKNRIKEGEASTFWNSLMGIDEREILVAEKKANNCQENEKAVILNANKREREYLISLDWLEQQAEKAGFITVINRNINAVGDTIIIFRKDKEEGE